MKILYVTTIGATMDFFKFIIKDLINCNHIVDIATNETDSEVPDCFREWGCRIFNISTSRSPFSSGNLKAVKQIKEIAKDYDTVHCHTPLAAMATRLGCRKLRRFGLKVIYTAHGFHFYKGAPLKNWLIYYPMEKFCSRFTDTLITINKEDFELAKRKMKAKQIEYVPGVGIDVNRFAATEIDRNAKRKELGIPENAFVLLSVGELNSNKNHQVVIKALAKLNKPDIHYIIAGVGDQKNTLENLAKTDNVNLHLLGFRKDIAELHKASDVFLLPSIREGLNVSVMEAMAGGMPCIVSDIRGNRDMVDTDGGSLCNPFSADDFAKAIEHEQICLLEHGIYNARKAKMFDVLSINEMMKKIYELTSH